MCIGAMLKTESTQFFVNLDNIVSLDTHKLFSDLFPPPKKVDLQ